MNAAVADSGTENPPALEWHSGWHNSSYKIASQIFRSNKQADLRDSAVGVIQHLLQRLKLITGEVERKYQDQDAAVSKPEAEEATAPSTAKTHDKK